LFLSKLPEGSEISLDAEHDIIYFSCYGHSIDDEEFLTKEQVEEIQKYRPGFHYNSEIGSWATFV